MKFLASILATLATLLAFSMASELPRPELFTITLPNSGGTFTVNLSAPPDDHFGAKLGLLLPALNPNSTDTRVLETGG
jgi:hypothetical protein